MRKRILSLFTAMLACLTFSQQSVVIVSANYPVKCVSSKSYSQKQSEFEYQIKPKDLLEIRIEGVSTYNGSHKIEVTDRGMIKMTMIGEVRAAGRTTAELEAEIATRLDEYLINPKVHISVIKQRT